jgi:hypothetical protein
VTTETPRADRPVLLLLGSVLAALGVPIAFLISLGAFRKEGLLTALMALAMCSIPVVLGAVLVFLGKPGIWRASSLRDLWRSSVALGFAITFLSLPLMLVFPSFSLWIAFLAVSAFALADPLLTVLRASWWLGAVLSIVVGLFLLVVLGAAADSVQPFGAGGMVFLLPVFIHPAALGVAGLTRLGASRGLWSRTTGFAVALALGGAGLLLMGLLPFLGVLVERVTGNTPANTTYSGNDGEVVSSTPHAVSVRLSGRIESYGLAPQTTFEFRGPGWKMQTEPCGPAWLKPGQRVQVDYVRRGGAFQATLVTVWVERQGCPTDWGSPKSDAALAPAGGASGLEGMAWEGRLTQPDTGQQWPSERWEFLEGGAFAYTSNAGSRHADGRWRQHGRAVSIEKDNCYAQYEGVIDGDTANGSFHNVDGLDMTWTARRLPAGGTAAPAASK